jgi:predicted phage-related endonuclease
MRAMKIERFEDEDTWLEARLGKITGTKSKDVLPKKRGEGYRAGFYELIAERVALPADGENVMDRGKRLEEDAVERFAKETGKKVRYELVLCMRDDNDDIAYSPDALIGKTEDVEVKCLSSAKHIEALLTKKVPTDYEPQIIQGFVVNDKLKTRYMVFYDPRMPKDFFYLTIHRKDYEEKIKEYLELERTALKEIALIESELTF